MEIPHGYSKVKDGEKVQQGDLIYSTYFQKKEWRQSVTFGYPAVESQSVIYIRKK